MQPATTFQKIHVLNFNSNSHDDIKYMKNICRDACGCHSICITIGCVVAPWWHQEKTCFATATCKRFLIIKLLLLTCMYPLFVGAIFGLRPCGFILFVYELFISESKSQVYGILHDGRAWEHNDRKGNRTHSNRNMWWPYIVHRFEVYLNLIKAPQAKWHGHLK